MHHLLRGATGGSGLVARSSQPICQIVAYASPRRYIGVSSFRSRIMTLRAIAISAVASVDQIVDIAILINMTIPLYCPVRDRYTLKLLVSPSILQSPGFISTSAKTI